MFRALFHLLSVLSMVFSPAVFAQTQTATAATVEPDPPPEVRALIVRTLGDSAEVLRYGSFSTPDSLEAVGAVTVPQIPVSAEGSAVSRLVVFRRVGTRWAAGFTVDNSIRNDAGMIVPPPAETPSFYRVAFFEHRFDDGRRRWVIQLTPIARTGNPAGRPIDISWNEAVGRYQEISLGGFGFQPEFHGEAAE